MELNIINDIVFVFLLLAVGYFIISNILIRLKNKRLFIAAAQAEADRLTVYDQVQEILKREAERSQEGDGFIKFMSQSRDWAFEYIEEVQADLYELKEFVYHHGTAPKTVAQANEMNKILSKILNHLPKEKDEESV